MADSFRILIVEDEALLAMMLEAILVGDGHIVVATAMSSAEAIALADELDADLALVDIHLADGPTGTAVSRFITQHTRMKVIFTTANARRLADDFSGAIGVIAKPYTGMGISSAIAYLADAVRRPPPAPKPPRSLILAPDYAQQWT